ncbi:terminal uridylyltransferase 7-like [Gossypium australe]|uniref:Terminal uridylyltransferase 7-like n=1 Tax=Gossypium australe TaxID=47621 RepID=A0A5B6VLG1_9ROSI|nr:terminal uridylyltransferase 7-like [Gossypium australe]
MSSRGRQSRNSGNVGVSISGMKDTTVRSETQTSARPYTIRAHKEASAPNVPLQIFSYANQINKCSCCVYGLDEQNILTVFRQLCAIGRWYKSGFEKNFSCIELETLVKCHRNTKFSRFDRILSTFC